MISTDKVLQPTNSPKCIQVSHKHRVYVDKLLLYIHVHLLISVPYLISAMHGNRIFKNSEESCDFICLDEGNKSETC